MMGKRIPGIPNGDNMSKFAGYTQEQRYRVAWRTTTGEQSASESMTRAEAELLRAGPVDVSESRLEQWNGWEWERV